VSLLDDVNGVRRNLFAGIGLSASCCVSVAEAQPWRAALSHSPHNSP
jgi:hypothetical protein